MQNSQHVLCYSIFLETYNDQHLCNYREKVFQPIFDYEELRKAFIMSLNFSNSENR